ncbi:PEP/pyruvate-binding domain-containing protein [Roseofilum sp. BLCC_M154]|uniref:PEP/pyruvate-binding domain-containing protein n=1 Tax=Roseofilum acuticapitatum BLCC-M154 TaxID=3022444 RepID=A0ABT7AZP1_9CYAN|nr:PEP/pyruvate-binding domain-containing protein [Roseofilum acuticapitatum]MDJ1172382.1 PEP/pyruvate-binding domain-containing protein [Roseofilum acuticapitatum BLCC-M154]
MTYILTAQNSKNPQQLGGKGAALAQLQALNLPIPEWFVVSPSAFYHSLTEGESLTTDTIPQVIAALHLNHKVKAELAQALKHLSPNGELVAVRSSAVDEDGADYSFAGQLQSFLFVPLEEVDDRVVEVWRSGFGDRLLAYRQQHHLGNPKPPAVLIQRMVNAEIAGVAFSADPVTGQRGVTVISAVSGVGDALVSGEVDGQTYRIHRQGTIISAPEDNPLLNPETLKQITHLVRQVGAYFGRPQDIEWAIENNQVYLLQARPITGLAKLPDPDAQLNLWDNSNISESYSGVTTPLTFSFARRAYEEVYRQFCLLMAVDKTVVENNDSTFNRMIGLIQGRVYYNLLSWYKVLSLLPGFQVNRRFMEQMMGVKEPISDEILESIGIQPSQKPTLSVKILDSLRLLRTVVGLGLNFILLPSKIKEFYGRLMQVLGQKFKGLELQELRADELVAHYRDLERQLLRSWDAPLINDFFAMIFYGILKKLCQSWGKETSGSLQNDLISGEGGMISAEPAMRVKELARLVAQDEALTQVFCEGELGLILSELEKRPEVRQKYEAYLDKFGDRCLGELKLESPTLFDNPLLLLRSVGQLAKSGQNLDSASVSGDLRQAAEAKVREKLGNFGLKRWLFDWVLYNARERVRDRENLRFERTRLFGHVRRIFVELGKRFVALDLLDDYRDIFYLEVTEILGFVEGTNTCTNLKGLVQLRKAKFAEYEQNGEIGDRFETRGIVYQGNRFQENQASIVDSDNPDTLQGLGCCPGIVEAQVRVITNPENAILEPGSILVAERTDPGWIMLFPAASGVLVERGSLLSHSAIVAREMGIPAIVSLPGVTRFLKDGDWVKMDGSTGRVERLIQRKAL